MEIKTVSDNEISVIRGLLQALVIRGQIHGPHSLSYDEYTNEKRWITAARTLVEENDRINNIEKDPWTV